MQPLSLPRLFEIGGVHAVRSSTPEPSPTIGGKKVGSVVGALVLKLLNDGVVRRGALNPGEPGQSVVGVPEVSLRILSHRAASVLPEAVVRRNGAPSRFAK